MEKFPVVAEGMNRMPKVVFSRTLDNASWNNTRLVKDGMSEAVRQMKSESGPGMVIMGSGSIVSQLAEAGLIDEFQIVMSPVAIGKGRTMFETLTRRLNLKRTQSRTFENGNVLLCYEPAA
jgi:dihydrofolate reductase